MEDSRLMFDGRVQWDFNRKSLTVSEYVLSKEDKKRKQYLITVSFGNNYIESNDVIPKKAYKRFIARRKEQHAKIKEIHDIIFNVYEELYGNPTWIIEEKDLGRDTARH
jgi:hypothetical protein